MQTYSSNHDLIIGIRQRKQTAASKLYDDYSSSLFSYIIKIIADHSSAEKILQSVFIKVWEDIDEFDVKRGNLFVWMLNIARTEAIEKILKCDSDIKFNQVDTPMVSSKLLPGYAFVSSLSTFEKTVTSLVYCRGFSAAEASELLKIPQTLVDNKIRVVLQKLTHFKSQTQVTHPYN